MAWLRNHSAEFWKLVFEKLGKEVADSIDNSSIRLICIASDFTREDLGAYELMPDNIDLIRYRRFGDSHLLLERITSFDTEAAATGKETSLGSGRVKAFVQWLEEAPSDLREVYEKLREVILSQGEDVSEKQTKLYVAFKRIKNFASVTYASKTELILYLRVDPKQVELHDGMRDVSNINHWGTGDLEVRIRTSRDVERVIPLIQRAYEGNL